MKPEFSSFLVKEQENEIFDLIGRLIQTLSSPKIAIDDRHTPKLYARFLAGLLSRHRRDGATVGRLQTNPPPSTHAPDTTQPSVTQPPSSTSSRATGGGQPMDQSFSQAPTNLNQVMDTPIYMPEATFAASTGQIDFGADYEMSYGGNIFSDEEMLATMQAIKNPAWWETMMMPGCAFSVVSKLICTDDHLDSPGRKVLRRHRSTTWFRLPFIVCILQQSIQISEFSMVPKLSCKGNTPPSVSVF